MQKPSGGISLAAIMIGVLALGAAVVGGSWSQGGEDAQGPRVPVTEAAQTSTPTTATARATTAAATPALRVRTYAVATVAEFQDAVTKTRPGDTIRITKTLTGPVEYRGDKAGPRDGVGRSGRPGEPITITADPGVWIDPGDISNDEAGLDILFVDHIHVVGVRVRNTEFGIRFMNVEGTAANPIRVVGNTVTNTGRIGIAVIGDYAEHRPCRFFELIGNTISKTGRYVNYGGEGIYVGTGEVAFVDFTSDVLIRGNELFDIPAEAIDIKPATRRVTVEQNRIHDIWPHNSAAIMAIYTSVVPNPDPSIDSEIVIRNNRIWNINLADVPDANDRGIWVGHGGVEVTGNIIWSMRDDANLAEAVVVDSPAPFGPHPIVIRDNIVWSRGGLEINSGSANVQRRGNIGPRGAENVTAVAPSYFVGPIPAHGSAGSADAGAGPGSAFQTAGNTTPTATPTPRPTATATPRPTATATPRPTATATPRPTATPTSRPTATAVPTTTTPAPTVSATSTPIAAPTSTPTLAPTSTPTAAATPTSSAAATPTATATPTPITPAEPAETAAPVVGGDRPLPAVGSSSTGGSGGEGPSSALEDAASVPLPAPTQTTVAVPEPQTQVIAPEVDVPTTQPPADPDSSGAGEEIALPPLRLEFDGIYAPTAPPAGVLGSAAPIQAPLPTGGERSVDSLAGLWLILLGVAGLGYIAVRGRVSGGEETDLSST